MSMNMFDQSAISFKLMKIVKPEKSKLLENCVNEVMPDLTEMDRYPIAGYVESKRHFGRNLSHGNLVFGKYVCMGMASAERKIPPSLLEIKLDEAIQSEKTARGVDFLPRKFKAEIKAELIGQLTPDMPPTVDITPFVVDESESRILVGALTDNKCDNFCMRFQKTSEVPAIPMSPNVCAVDRKGVDLSELPIVSFSPDMSVEPPMCLDLGMEFLTWLWYTWEVFGGDYIGLGGESVAYSMEGPISMYGEGVGSQEVTLRNGTPLQCSETAKALYCGKQLTKVKLNMVIDGEIYKVAIDSSFGFRGLTLPKEEDLTKDVFFDRMRKVNYFLNAFFGLFDTFMDCRNDKDRWENTVKFMRKWIYRMND